MKKKLFLRLFLLCSDFRTFFREISSEASTQGRLKTMHRMWHSTGRIVNIYWLRLRSVRQSILNMSCVTHLEIWYKNHEKLLSLFRAFESHQNKHYFNKVRKGGKYNSLWWWWERTCMYWIENCSAFDMSSGSRRESIFKFISMIDENDIKCFSFNLSLPLSDAIPIWLIESILILCTHTHTGQVLIAPGELPTLMWFQQLVLLNFHTKY